MDTQIKNKMMKSRWWVAGIFSYLVPGLGHVYCNKILRGFFLNIIYSSVGVLFVSFILNTLKSDFSIESMVYFYLYLSITGILMIFIIVDAIRYARKEKERICQAYDKWYVYGAIILLVFCIDQKTKFTIVDVVFQAFVLPTKSMNPTLKVGDYFLFNKIIYSRYNPKRGEIIVFKFPQQGKNKYPQYADKDFVKRIIGLPHDTIVIKNKKVSINSKNLDEPYIQYTDPSYHSKTESSRDNFGPFVIPSNKYFVLGDNRDNSLDSRFWGTVEREEIKGKAGMIYFSVYKQIPFIRFNRIGKKI